MLCFRHDRPAIFLFKEKRRTEGTNSFSLLLTGFGHALNSAHLITATQHRVVMHVQHLNQWEVLSCCELAPPPVNLSLIIIIFLVQQTVGFVWSFILYWLD